MEKITIDGAEFSAVTLPTQHTRLLVIAGSRGMLGCGYLNLGAAEKFGDALAIVTGVGSYEEMLNASVKSVSPAAAALGIRPGMTGRAALGFLK